MSCLSAAQLAICEYKYCVKQKVIIGLFSGSIW